jgi:predicted Zn-dependent protease
VGVLRKLAVAFLILLPVTSFCAPQDDVLIAKSRRAKELMAAGKAEEAIPIYRDLVRTLPNNPGLRMNLGLALDMAGRKPEAVREYEAVLKFDPHSVPALLFLGTAYVELGEPAKAIEPLEKVVGAQPDNLDAQEVLSEALLSLGRLEQAAKRFQILAQQDAGNPKVWYGLGLSYERLAQRDFEELEEVALGSAYWLVLVAESRLKVTQYYSAFYFYRQALAKMPSMRGVHGGLAEVYRKTSHADWAAIEEEKERAMPPPDCNVQKLECEFQTGRYLDVVASPDARTAEAYYWRTRAYNQLALEAFSGLGQLSPSAEMHELIAKMESSRRQYVESVREWREALKLSPGNPHLQEGLAVALYQSRDLQGARALFEDLLKREPDSAELNYMLGDTLLNSQKPQDAIPYLNKAVTLDPQLLAAHSSLARSYLALGEAEKAVPHLKAALPIDEDGSLHYQLGRAYQARGELALAREMLKKYQEIHNAQEAANKTVEKEVEITPP